MTTKLKDFFKNHPTAASWRPATYSGLSSSDEAVLTEAGYQLHRGKVREMARLGDIAYMIHSDRLTAFDRLIAEVPFKGYLLASISAFWLEQLKDVCPNHFLGRPQSRIIKCHAAKPIKVEVVVRGYLAGAMQRAYEGGKRLFCGEPLPEGLHSYAPLPRPFLTPTTKAAAFEHDEETTAGELIARGICSDDEWQQIDSFANNLFRRGQELYAKSGWLLVDTKYEFGKLPDGSIILIDEVHTPDSSRLWVAETYEQRLAEHLPPDMFDKEIIRRALLQQGFQGFGPVPDVPEQLMIDLLNAYVDVAEDLIGEPVSVPTDGDPGQWLKLQT